MKAMLAGLMLLLVGGGAMFYFLKKKEIETLVTNKGKISAAGNLVGDVTDLIAEFRGKKTM